jgi:hypothetical protein
VERAKAQMVLASFLGTGDGLDHDAQLVSAFRCGLEWSHDGVAAIEVEQQLVILGRNVGEVVRDPAADGLDDLIDLGDEDRVAGSGDGDGAVPDPSGGLDLHRVAVGRDER